MLTTFRVTPHCKSPLVVGKGRCTVKPGATFTAKYDEHIHGNLILAGFIEIVSGGPRPKRYRSIDDPWLPSE